MSSSSSSSSSSISQTLHCSGGIVRSICSNESVQCYVLDSRPDEDCRNNGNGLESVVKRELPPLSPCEAWEPQRPMTPTQSPQSPIPVCPPIVKREVPPPLSPWELSPIHSQRLLSPNQRSLPPIPVCRPDGNRSILGRSTIGSYSNDDSQLSSNLSQPLATTFERTTTTNNNSVKVTPELSRSSFANREITIRHGEEDLVSPLHTKPFDTIAPMELNFCIARRTTAPPAMETVNYPPQEDMDALLQLAQVANVVQDTATTSSSTEVAKESPIAPNPRDSHGSETCTPSAAGAGAVAVAAAPVFRDQDILFGKVSKGHPGNQRRGALIAAYYSDYNAATTHPEKELVCSTVMSLLQAEKRRFWKRVEDRTNVLVKNRKEIYKRITSLFRDERNRRLRRAQRAATARAAEREELATYTGAATVTGATKDTTKGTPITAGGKGVTLRPSGKWQVQLYFCGKLRYIGVFDAREKADLAFRIARTILLSARTSCAKGGRSMSPCSKQTEAAVISARKAAFEGVRAKYPANKTNPPH